MDAIVEIGGHQFRVEKDHTLYVNRLEAKEGEQVELDRVLLTEDNGQVTVGTPTIDEVRVKARVLGHTKGDKVNIFKKKRRKGYRRMKGHRQALTRLQIEEIGAGKKKSGRTKTQGASSSSSKKETSGEGAEGKDEKGA